MYSLREIGAIALCVGLFVKLGGMAVQAIAHRFGRTLLWWEGMPFFVATLVLIAMVVLAVRFPDERAAERRRNAEAAKRRQTKVQLELQNPGAKVTLLSSGCWLLTDIATGRTIREVASQDINLSA